MMIEQTALVTKIHTKKEHVKNALSTISDNEEYRDYLLTELHNINFSRENFTECKPSSSEDVFIASFGEHSLEFSNRASSFELRGEALKKMLSDNDYCTLYELLSKTFCTKDDSYILCALAPIKAKLQLLKDECAEDIYKQVLMQIKDEDFVGISLSEYLASIFPVVSDNKND